MVLVKAFYDDRNCTSEIYNAFMYTRTANSPLIARMIAMARRRIASRSVDRAAGKQSCYAIAGPTLVAAALREAMLSTHCSTPTNICRNRFNGGPACNLQINTVYTTEDNETVMLLAEGMDEATTRKYDSPDGKMHAYSDPCWHEAHLNPWDFSAVYRPRKSLLQLWWGTFALWLVLAWRLRKGHGMRS